MRFKRKVLIILLILTSSLVFAAPLEISGGEVEGPEIRKPEIQFTSPRKEVKPKKNKLSKKLNRLKKTNKKLY